MNPNQFNTLRNARCELAWGKSQLWWEMCGLCDFSEIARNGIHRHGRHFEICAMISGHGIQEHGGVTIQLRPGDLFLAQPSVLHEIISDEIDPIKLVFFNLGIIDLNEEDSSTEGRLLRRFLDSKNIHCRGGDIIYNQLAILANSLELRASNQDYILELSVRALICEVFRRLSSNELNDANSSQPPIASSSQPPSRALEQALRFLDDNLTHPVTCSELARYSGLSERSLRRLFEEHLNTTPGREFLNRRMRWAARLLDDPRRSIHAVGIEIGIIDPSQFSRDFRRVMGKTPTEYRQHRTDHLTQPRPH